MRIYIRVFFFFFYYSFYLPHGMQIIITTTNNYYNNDTNNNSKRLYWSVSRRMIKIFSLFIYIFFMAFQHNYREKMRRPVTTDHRVAKNLEEEVYCALSCAVSAGAEVAAAPRAQKQVLSRARVEAPRRLVPDHQDTFYHPLDIRICTKSVW